MKDRGDIIKIRLSRDNYVEFEVQHYSLCKCLELFFKNYYEKYGVKYLLIVDERKDEDDN